MTVDNHDRHPAWCPQGRISECGRARRQRLARSRVHFCLPHFRVGRDFGGGRVAGLLRAPSDDRRDRRREQPARTTNLQRHLVDMPTTFTHFHPLGYVLTIMLGAGVAERAGLLGVPMRAAVKGAPKFLLTPAIAFVGMMGNLAADAAHVVLIPLAGVLFASAGRHPLAGIAAGFTSLSGGFSEPSIVGCRPMAHAGKAKAIRATAHKLARLIYTLLTKGEAYVDRGQDYFEAQYQKRVVKNLKRKALAMGFALTPIEAEAA